MCIAGFQRHLAEMLPSNTQTHQLTNTVESMLKKKVVIINIYLYIAINCEVVFSDVSTSLCGACAVTEARTLLQNLLLL